MSTNKSKTRDCCHKVFQEMHDLAATAWWGEFLVMASPCILVLPKLNPGASAGALLNTAMIELGKINISDLKKRILKNQSSSEFRNAVQDLWRWKYWPLQQMAVAHGNKHRGQPALRTFWYSIAEAYRLALVS